MSAPAIERLRLYRTTRTAGTVEILPSFGEAHGRRVPVAELPDGKLAIGEPGQDAQGAAWRQAVECLWAVS